jgi:hypothetical protein
MQKDRSFWPEWSHTLKKWGLAELIAALLEAVGPVHGFLAQIVFAAQPFLNQVIPHERLSGLVSLVEDQEESRSFAAFIREESSG